jgi:hypothetical protein
MARDLIALEVSISNRQLVALQFERVDAARKVWREFDQADERIDDRVLTKQPWRMS